MTGGTVPLLKQPMVLLVDSDPDVIDLTSSSYDESENDETFTTPEKPVDRKREVMVSEGSHVVEHGDAHNSRISVPVDRATETALRKIGDTRVVSSSGDNQSILSTKDRQKRLDTPGGDIAELDKFFEGKVRSIGVDEENRLPVEHVLNRRTGSDQVGLVEQTSPDEINLSVPQSTQQIDNSSSLSTSTSSDSKKDNSTFISGIYSSISKVRNLFLPNNLFTQDKINEEEKEEEEASAVVTRYHKINDSEASKHSQISSQDFKLPHSTSQSTRNNTLNTSSFEVNTISSQLPNQTYYMEKSQQPQPQLASLSLVVPDSTTSLSSSSSQSQSQHSQLTSQRKTGSTSNDMHDSVSSTKTLLPLNNEPLRSKNPLLQFSQLSGSLLQMRIDKNPQRKKAKSRKLKKVIGSTDEEDEESIAKREERTEEEIATIPSNGKRISSFGLQPISTDKVGKITGSKTFISEEIGLDDTMKIASSGGLFDDDDRHHRQKEVENTCRERVTRACIQTEEETSDRRRLSGSAKHISTIELELSASENEIEESDSLEVLEVNQYLNALEEQSDSNIENMPGDSYDTAANDVVDNSKEKADAYSIQKSDTPKLEESQATQSNVINEMLNFYEEEFQNQQLEDIHFNNDFRENTKNSADYSNLFVPEDESYDSNLIGDSSEQYKSNDKILKEGELRDIGNIAEDDEDDEDEVLIVKKDRKKQISHRLMSLARQKRKKKLSEYNPYSDSDSGSERDESTSDLSSGYISSPNDNKNSRDFIVNDNSVEFESDSDSGDELAKNELLSKLQERSERESKTEKKRKKIESEMESSDDEQQQRKQQRRKPPLQESMRIRGKRARTRSSRLKEKRIEGKDVIVLDSDSAESLGNAEIEPDDHGQMSVVKMEHPFLGDSQMALLEVKSNIEQAFFEKADIRDLEPEQLEPEQLEPKQLELKETEPKEIDPKEIEQGSVPEDQKSEGAEQIDTVPKEFGLKEPKVKEIESEKAEVKEADINKVIGSTKLQFSDAVKHIKKNSGQKTEKQVNETTPANHPASPTDCSSCTRQKNSDLIESCDRQEICSNCKRQGVACVYHPEKGTTKVDKTLKKFARKQSAKKKKKAPKSTDNSLLEKLNERLRVKHGKKKDKRNGQTGR